MPTKTARSNVVAARTTARANAKTNAKGKGLAIAAVRPTVQSRPLPPLGQAYLDHMRFERRLSALTIDNVQRDLRDLAAFAAGARLEVRALAHQDIRRFIASAHSRGMTPKALARLLSGWRGFFKYALRQGHGHVNPCDGVRAPKAEKRLPRTLSPEEAISLVSFTTDDPQSVRDRAAFEMIYSCGLRISECVGLNLDSIDFGAREVRVLGKGSKTRIVPVGDPAIEAVKQWLNVRRPAAATADSQALFLGVQGKRVSASVLQARIKLWALRQGIDVNVHPHMLRHSFASHLLQSSQNLRAVQEMMGHASIGSTQVYTHLDFQHLAKVYDAAHPRAKQPRIEFGSLATHASQSAKPSDRKSPPSTRSSRKKSQ
jgi:integrase/recombinase XerC